MIDIHSHLLPGVDDGATSMEQSVATLRRLAAEGVSEVVLTPHLLASRASAAPLAHHRALFAALCRLAPAGVGLRLGWEIMLDRPGVDFTADGLSLGRSRALLVEFPRMMLPPRSIEELRRIRESGMVPVVAHPERYVGCTPPLVAEWREAGVVIQLDASAPLPESPFQEAALALLRAGLVDLVAADNHGDTRSLAVVRDWFAARGRPDLAQLLTSENPRRLLADDRLLPVPPLDAAADWGDRLRGFALRRLTPAARRAAPPPAR